MSDKPPLSIQALFVGGFLAVGFVHLAVGLLLGVEVRPSLYLFGLDFASPAGWIVMLGATFSLAVYVFVFERATGYSVYDLRPGPQ